MAHLETGAIKRSNTAPNQNERIHMKYQLQTTNIKQKVLLKAMAVFQAVVV